MRRSFTAIAALHVPWSIALLVMAFGALGASGSTAVAQSTSTAVAQSTSTAAAQPTCTTEAEPNDQPDTAVAVSGAACLAGSLPDGDAQDTWVWTVGESDAGHTWTFGLTGVAGTMTAVQLIAVTSAPGVAPIVWDGSQLFELDAGPDDGSVSSSDLIVPMGEYVLGVGRTASMDGTSPASFDYQVTVQPGDPLPPRVDTKPNGDVAHASRVAHAFAVSGDIAASQGFLAWTLNRDDATHGWDVELRGGLGTSESLMLLDADGRALTSASIDPAGSAHLYDLHLAPARYLLEVTGGTGNGPHPYLLTAAISDATGADPEPNDDPFDAIPIVPGVLMRGRLARSGDRDQYLLDVDAAASQTLLDVRLIWRSGPVRQVCLSSLDANLSPTQLQCSLNPSGQPRATLVGLRLRAGSYLLTVTGDASPPDPYGLRIDATTPPAPDFETEPNDTPQTATPLVEGAVMHARALNGDPDVFRETTTGTDQLWRVDVQGSQLDSLTWLLPDWTVLAQGEVSQDRSSVTLSDAFLPAGDHWFEVVAEGGDYTVTLTPEGPPDPGAEREPNNDTTYAQPLFVGSSISGRLPETTDVDVYRFSLSATDHVRIGIDPPVDGAIATTLLSSGVQVASFVRADPGQAWTYDALLQPGDYELWLQPIQTSAADYHLGLVREDPFTIRQDQEPDDSAAAARPMPSSLTVSGTLDGTSDQDWFRLDALSEAGTLTVVTSGMVTVLGVSDGTTELPVVEGGDGRTYTVGPAPSGVPLYLHILPAGDYSATIVSGTTAAAGHPAPTLVFDTKLALATDVTAVAAYWSAGQTVHGSLAVTNVGVGPERLTLDAATSDYSWTAALDQSVVTVAAGSTVRVPVTITALPDAWADIPVRITVRAREAIGAQATTSVDITPGRATTPVGAHLAWSVPDALLGGLDVAATVLGAAPIPSVDAAGEALLYDGVEHVGRSLVVPFSGQPLTLTVDLAGDAAVPVAGIIIDPIGPVVGPTTAPRDFQLLLSTDGATYTVALSGEISPLPRDQAFVLPAPMDARFAQLRIVSTWAGPGTSVAISEWKVVARPGAVVSSEPFDVASDQLGGHIVWATPAFSDSSAAQEMLIGDAAAPLSLAVDPGARFTWVVGFQDDRSAQLTELQWVDPMGSDPRSRMSSVDVAVSDSSPLGPWQDVGTWKLVRHPDGSVASFELASPTWARFVRFTGGRTGKDTHIVELPRQLLAIETPTGDGYRSIIGEWGQDGTSGPHEWLAPPDTSLPTDSGEPNDTLETATPLGAGSVATGTVHRGTDVDYYALTTGTGQNSLTFSVTGRPTVGVSLSLFDASGEVVPLTLASGVDPLTATYTADVDPGATYRVEVEQPDFSAVFAFDSSGSMRPYMSVIEQVRRAYLRDRLGDEAPAQVIDFTDDRTQQAITRAAQYLAARVGTLAVLVITDMEVAGYPDSQSMWRELSQVRPLLFTELAGDLTPYDGGRIAQDLAMAGYGPFDYIESHADGDRAFDRMATWLRRAAEYSLSYTASARALPPPQPGTLSVTTVGANGQTTRAPASTDVAVDIILDTSGSMLDRFGGESRIASARKVLADLVTNELPVGAPVAVRVLGSSADPCGTRLLVPLGPLDPVSVTTQVNALTVHHAADTPIGQALRAVPSDLSDATGTRIVLLITDSKEIWPNKDLCGSNPADAIKALQRQGVDGRINIVGLAIDSPRARRQLRGWAKLGGGSYFDASDARQLGDAIRTAVSAPFQVFDTSGASVATGTVGGAPVKLPPRTYRVVILTEPATTRSATVRPGEALTLTLTAQGVSP